MHAGRSFPDLCEFHVSERSRRGDLQLSVCSRRCCSQHATPPSKCYTDDHDTTTASSPLLTNEPPKIMGRTRQQIQTAQGALYLIDNIGAAPPGVVFRHFTDHAIAEHLKHHSYYYQQRGLPGLENRMPVTPHWMRRFLRDLLFKNKQAAPFPGLEGDDAADTLFRKGSTKDFPSAVLRRYEYDRTIFSESDLPGNAELGDEAGSDGDAEGELESIEGVRGQQNDTEANAGITHRQILTRQASREAAAPFSSPFNDYGKSFTPAKDDTDVLSSENSEYLGDGDDNDRYFDGNEYLDGSIPTDSGPQVVIETAAILPAKAMPTSLEKVKIAVEDTEHAIAKVEPPKRRGRPPTQAVFTATQPASKTFPSAAESFGASQLTSSLTSLGATPELPLSKATSLSLLRHTNSSSQGSQLPAQSKENIQTQGRKWIGAEKRKRESVDFDSMINSGEDETVTNSAKRKKSQPASKVGSRPVNHDTAMLDAPISSNPTFATLTPSLSTATPHGRPQPHTRPSAEEEVKDSQSSQHTVPSQVLETKHQAVPFKADEHARNFEQFYQMLQPATDQVIASIGDLSGSLSFLDPNSSDCLEALYKRCWGPHWEAVRLKLTKDYVFTVPEVAMSLISAFLYNNVFNQQASVFDIQTKQLELRGTTGRAILRILDLDNKGEHVLRKFPDQSD